MTEVDKSSKLSRSEVFRSLRGGTPLLSRHKGLLIGWLLALGVTSSATLTLPIAARRIIDQGLGASMAHTNKAFVFAVAVAIIMAIGTAIRFYFISLLGERTVGDLRKQLYSHLIGMDLAFHDRHRSGDLISRLTADAELLRSVIGSTISVALRSLVTVFGSLAMLFVTSPRLAAYTLIGIPLAVLPIVFAGRTLAKASRRSQDRIGDANSLATETLQGVATVQSNTREDYERGRYTQSMDLAVRTARKRITTQSLVTALVMLLVFCSIIAVLWLGANDVTQGHMSGGTLAQFLFYAIIGAGSVGALAEVWNELQKAGGGMSRISELLETPAAVQDTGNARPESVRGELQFRDVRFEYANRSDRPAIHGFNLHIQPGERVALVGPSGAGKTTVLNLLMRFYDPTDGSIAVDGTDIRQVSLQSLRENIALVPQSPSLFAASVMDNIRYGRLDAGDDEVIAAARAANALEFIQALPEGFNTLLGERGARLSGGQQQRVAIARAILKNAPILLLDEATSALDAQSERAVQEALEHLMANRTSLVIAHRLATVRNSDRIVVMDQGTITAIGTHDSLLAEGGLYADLAALQFMAMEP